MSIATGAFQVTASASKVLSAVDIAPNSVMLYNSGPNTIFVGSDATVTAANGFPVLSGATLTIDRGHGSSDLWAICSVLQVSPADTRYMAET